MKLILSRHYTPSTHWTNWVAEDFDFSDYAQPWEHPGISPLAFETKATYGQLDVDSDAFLKTLVEHLWAKDFANRSGEIDDELVEMSQRLLELHEMELDIFTRESFTIDDVPLDWFRKSEFAGKNLDDDYDWGDATLNELWGNTKNRAVVCVAYYNEVIAPEVEKLWQEIIVRMLVTKTNPSREAVADYATQCLWKEDCEHYRDYPEMLTSEKRGEFFSKPEEKFHQWALERSYEAAIACFPVENLFSYFHDEIVFNNYIQMTVMYGREWNVGGGLVVPEGDETVFVSSRRLLDFPESVTEDEVRFLVGRAKYWWT